MLTELEQSVSTLLKMTPSVGADSQIEVYSSEKLLKLWEDRLSSVQVWEVFVEEYAEKIFVDGTLSQGQLTISTELYPVIYVVLLDTCFCQYVPGLW